MRRDITVFLVCFSVLELNCCKNPIATELPIGERMSPIRADCLAHLVVSMMIAGSIHKDLSAAVLTDGVLGWYSAPIEESPLGLARNHRFSYGLFIDHCWLALTDSYNALLRMDLFGSTK